MHPTDQRPVFDPIVPVKFFPNTLDNGAEISSIHRRTGYGRYLVKYPGLDVRIEGFPPAGSYEHFGTGLAEIKRSVASRGIEVGWWASGTLKCGRNPMPASSPVFGEYDFQRITDISGVLSPISSCPLEPRFVDKFVSNAQAVVQRAHPFLILLEDDFELSNHTPVRFGCFCPLHLDLFAERSGGRYSREDLAEIFRRETRESASLRRLWAEGSRDSLVGLARTLRRGVDEIDPSVRIGLCQPGVGDRDGDLTVPVARALAGEDHRPLVRVYGTSYSSDEPLTIPRSTFHLLYTKQSAPADFELIHESDTYPHTRFFMSATKLNALLTTALLYGLEGSLLFVSQHLDYPLEEVGYSDMATRDGARFGTVMAAAKGCAVVGVEVVYDPFQHTCRGYDPESGRRPSSESSPWAQVFGRLGVPYTTLGGEPKAVAGQVFCEWSEDQIRELLSGSVFLDGAAAFELCQRGFSEDIGVRANRSEGRIRSLYEQISDDLPWPADTAGRLVYNFAVAPAGQEAALYYELEGCADTEVVTTFLTPSFEPLYPAMTVHENSLGGRIAVTAYDLEVTQSSALFNYRKKSLMKDVIEWLRGSRLPVYAMNHPNVFVVALEQTSGDYGVSAIFNLSTDTFEKVDLRLDGRWAAWKQLQVLEHDGSWQDIAAVESEGSAEGAVAEIRRAFRTMRPVILKHGIG